MDNSSFKELSIFIYNRSVDLKTTGLARMGTASFCEAACFLQARKRYSGQPEIAPKNSYFNRKLVS